MIRCYISIASCHEPPMRNAHSTPAALRTGVANATSIFALVALFVAIIGCGPDPHVQPASPPQSSVKHTSSRPLYYRNPMDPRDLSNEPRIDSMGMPFVPVYEKDIDAGTATLGAGLLQQLGVRVAAATLAPLEASYEAQGVVELNQNSIQGIYAPIEGWVEHLSTRTAGERVTKGQRLLSLVSTRLALVDEQYIHSLKQPGTSPNPFEQAMLSLGIRRGSITALRDGKRSVGEIPFDSHLNGIVTEVNYREGALAPAGATLLTLAETDPIWVIVEVNEAVARAMIREAVPIATLTHPTERTYAQIDYVYPNVDATTRRIRVRLLANNDADILKQGMYVSARLNIGSTTPVVQVPRAAVVRSGKGDHVLMSTPDGRFERRSISVGREGHDNIEVLSGLDPGDRVVASATFLLDSESNVETALRRLAPTGDGT